MQICSRCGGGRAHHAVADEKCWCPTCLPLAEENRCESWTPIEKEMPAKRRRSAGTARVVDLPRTGSQKRLVYDTIHKAGAEGATDEQVQYVTGKKIERVRQIRQELLETGLIRRHMVNERRWVVT